MVSNQEFADLPNLPDKAQQRSQDFHQLLVDPEMGGLDPEKVHHLVNCTMAEFVHAINKVARACDADSSVLLFITSRSGRIRRGLARGSYIIMSDTVRNVHHNTLLVAAFGDAQGLSSCHPWPLERVRLSAVGRRQQRD